MRPAAACFIHFFIPSRHIILRQAVCLFVKIPKNYASYPLRCVHNRILCSQHSEPKSELWRVVGVINLWPQLRHSHPTRAPLWLTQSRHNGSKVQWQNGYVTIVHWILVQSDVKYTSENQKIIRYIYQIIFKFMISKMEKIFGLNLPITVTCGCGGGDENGV